MGVTEERTGEGGGGEEEAAEVDGTAEGVGLMDVVVVVTVEVDAATG